jgi:hypothetical protein
MVDTTLGICSTLLPEQYEDQEMSCIVAASTITDAGTTIPDSLGAIVTTCLIMSLAFQGITALSKDSSGKSLSRHLNVVTAPLFIVFLGILAKTLVDLL